MPEKFLTGASRINSIANMSNIVILDKVTGSQIELASHESDRLVNMLKAGTVFEPNFPVLNPVIPGIKKPPVIFDPTIFDPVFTIPPRVLDPGFTLPLTPIVPQPPAVQQPTVGIDTQIQLLLGAIPIADPGNIITSEYHNALRDAVRALASRIGLSVNPQAEYKILSFAPNFMQMMTKNGGDTDASPSNHWDVMLERAAIPLQFNAELPVRGGFIVQLPDNADIIQMVVRGEKLEKDKTQPKQFNVRLHRLSLDDEKPEPLTLIDMDLQTLKDGNFEQAEKVKLSKEELKKITVGVEANTAERRRVKNADYLYFVTAEWFGGSETAAKSDINSVQIYCTV